MGNTESKDDSYSQADKMKILEDDAETLLMLSIFP